MADDARRDASPRRQTILLVDDEEDIRESLRALFETCLEGVDVETAASGMEALALLERARIDLLISDYKMPKMTGLELLSKAKRIAPDAPRILVTAFPDLEIAIRAINEASIENFFTKPFEPDEVLQVVRTLLREQRVQEMRDRSFTRSIEIARRDLDVRPNATK